MQKSDKQKLFVNWLIYLLDQRYGMNGWGTPDASHWSVYDGQHEVDEQGTSEASHWSVALADGSTIQVRFKPSSQPEVRTRQIQGCPGVNSARRRQANGRARLRRGSLVDGVTRDRYTGVGGDATTPNATHERTHDETISG
jgi:hypothetical protein